MILLEIAGIWVLLGVLFVLGFHWVIRRGRR